MKDANCKDCKYMRLDIDSEPCVYCDAAHRYYVPNEEHDNVNHPKHYMREGGMECIDEMIAIFGVEAVKHFCICNAWKYRYRAADKNGEEDLQKSDWYIRKFKELAEREMNDGK